MEGLSHVCLSYRHRILWAFLLYHQWRREGPDTQGSLQVKQPPVHSVMVSAKHSAESHISDKTRQINKRSKKCPLFHGIKEMKLTITMI